MLVAAAVVPCPPMIVPELARGAVAELDALRAACDRALAGLAETAPDRLVVLGAGDADATLEAGGTGSFAPYGLDLEVVLGAGAAQPLSPALTVGAWLLGRSPWAAERIAAGTAPSPVTAAVIASDADPARCAARGAELVAGPDRVALVVVGDGSACRTEKAPGYLDARAEPYDRALGAALADADSDALAALEPALAEELWVAGRPALQVLAGAAGPGRRGRLLYAEAPYGVGYFVALWS
ncbi:hypothetical protein [Embleya scabrispora]|uniref:hypothetical protein n=1 Tax=Embleya scabrispora TaxID=159449 RepID=UPI000477D4A7|nr:hypothetical protein [Embleya scabrispora]MYS80418.1 hypothetical protein [Streptomyces sp. SID5474]